MPAFPYYYPPTVTHASGGSALSTACPVPVYLAEVMTEGPSIAEAAGPVAARENQTIDVTPPARRDAAKLIFPRSLCFLPLVLFLCPALPRYFPWPPS